ncbi:MAG: hypothetical protein M1395_03420, partial [Bacteroidetes bacterium]|nr:hypothetical protein [Bacteroidota bacterium]
IKVAAKCVRYIRQRRVVNRLKKYSLVESKARLGLAQMTFHQMSNSWAAKNEAVGATVLVFSLLTSVSHRFLQ